MSMILSICRYAMAKTGQIIDERNRTAKELCVNLSVLCSTTRDQAQINLNHKLEFLRFDNKKVFSSRVNRFQEICDELAACGERIEDSRRGKGLVLLISTIRPQGFVGLAFSVW